MQEATIAICNGGDHALRYAWGLIEYQQCVSSGLRDRLRHRRVPWPLDPSLTVAPLTGVESLGLNPRELELNSRLCRFLAQRFRDVISLGSTVKSQLLSLRIDSVGLSSSGVLPSEDRSSLMDPLPLGRPLPLSTSSPSIGFHITYLPSSSPASPSRSEMSSEITSSVPSDPVTLT